LADTSISAPIAEQAKCVCPRCANQYLLRLARTGFFEKNFLPLFGYYPWICGACRKRKYFRIRGKRLPRTSHGESQ
jgi:hypothetical protein